MLRIIIHKGTLIYDDIIVDIHSVNNYDKKDVEKNFSTQLAPFSKKVGLNSYVLSGFVTNLKSSQIYRTSFLQAFVDLQSIIITMKLRIPKQQFLDHKWSERLTRMVEERRQLEYTMSWLSTLGGAFSALGDNFYHCAEIAGKISVQQFQLALRLGDPFLVARCNLWAALSLLQQGDFKRSKHIVRTVYRFARNKNDFKLQNMCQGIWAKLRYHCAMRKRSIVRAHSS